MHEVLATLLLNFVALLLVQQLLVGGLGQFGAGFLQSPELPPAVMAMICWQLWPNCNTPCWPAMVTTAHWRGWPT